MMTMPISQVKSLLLIASQLSGYPIPADAPTPAVRELTSREMAIEACDDSPMSQVLGCGVIGFFNTDKPDEVAIDFENGTAIDTDQSVNAITVHELTHWLQHHNNAWHRVCPDRFMVEYEAYKTTLTYQIKYEHLKPPKYFVVPQTGCPVDIKP